MTMINMNGKQIPLDVALSMARREYEATKKQDVRRMPKAQLERRKAAVLLYRNLLQMSQRSFVEHAMLVETR